MSWQNDPVPALIALGMLCVTTIIVAAIVGRALEVLWPLIAA